MSQNIAQIVDRFQDMVKSDGSVLELLGVQAGIVQLRYVAGASDECHDCVLPPDHLRELIEETIQRSDPSVTGVELVASS